MVIDQADKLRFFQDLYDDAKAYGQKTHDDLERHLAQYKGSKEIDGGEDALTVRNITYELIESQVSSYIPTPAVTPEVWNEKHERNAKTVENLLRNTRDRLDFEKMNDLDERYNPIYGGSIWLIEWDETLTSHNVTGDVKVTCLNPRNFVGQPGIYEVNDMEYCFVSFETTTDDIVRKYGVDMSALTANAEEGEESHDKTATIHICYYKNESDKVSMYVWSGDEELEDVEDYFARKSEDGNEEYETLDHDIPLSDGSILPMMSEKIGKDGQIVTETVTSAARTLDGLPAYDDVGGVLVPKTIEVQIPKLVKTKLPWYQPTLFPIVIRKNTSQEKSLLGQSDCEFIRPQQQAINKIESRILEKILKGGVFPVLPEDFEGDLDNSIFENGIRIKRDQIGLVDKLDLQGNIQQDIAQSDRLYDHAKRILGISDSFQGQYDSSATSGVAKQIQVQQSAGRLDSKRKMKNAAYAAIDRIVFQYYLAYADEPRPVVYRDEQGRLQNAQFNRYDFIERDETGEYYYEDRYLFSADASADIERDRFTLWAENRQNFQSGAYGNPQDLETLLIFWQNMEKAHYPWAHDNVERIRTRIAEIAQMQQMQAQMQQLTAQNQQQAQTIEAMNNPENIMAYAQALGGGR